MGEEKAKELWEDNVYGSHHFVYKSFVEYLPLPHNGYYTSINKAGYRYHNQKIDPKKKNIIFFGGSTMYGGGSDDNHTIPALTDQILENNFNVFNCGVSGNNSRHELAHLINFVNQGNKVDIVIFYDGINDIVNSCIGEGGINTTMNEEKIRQAIGQNFSKSDGLNYKKKLFDVFFQYTIELINSFKDNSNTDPFLSESQCFDEDYAEIVVSTIINNWEIAHDIVVGNGGRFIAILQPEANIGNPEIKHLQSLKSIIKNLSFDDEEYIYYSRYKSYQIIYPMLQEKMESYDYMIDMSNAFDGDEYIYIDHAHVTANGNMIIGNKIARLIEEISN